MYTRRAPLVSAPPEVVGRWNAVRDELRRQRLDRQRAGSGSAPSAGLPACRRRTTRRPLRPPGARRRQPADRGAAL